MSEQPSPKPDDSSTTDERDPFYEDFVGGSPAMKKVFATIRQVAPTNVDVLIQGETGTGKELVARSVHAGSPRADKPFIAVDCGAIPENLLESEFFGYEKGAFTGAESRRKGLLETCNGGTFFLDEIGELPLLLQAKLLRTLQERKLRRVGGNEEVPVDVRIVAATAKDLNQLVADKLFRDDLYYRINVVTIHLPALRKRGDDIGLLAEYFACRFSLEMDREVVAITPEAYQVMTRYSWPGNVRELQNVIRRGIVLTQDDMINVEDLPEGLVTEAGRALGGPEKSTGFFQARAEHVAEFEREYLSDLLQRHDGNVTIAAEEAQIPRGTLYRLMKNHELDGSDFR